MTAPKDGPQTRTPHNPREEGKLARRAGVLLTHNPYRGYRQHERLADEWEAGWLEEESRGKRP